MNLAKDNQIIAVMGGALIKDKKTGKWRTTHFDESDNFEVQGDYLRIYAAYYLFREKPNSKIILLGGRGQLRKIKASPGVALIMKKELIQLGVKPQIIITENYSANTFEQLKNLLKLIKFKDFSALNLISNKFHLPRIKAMLNYLEPLEEFKKIRINFISAEEICLKSDRQKWQPIISKAYKSRAIRKRIKLEKQGLQDIKTGKYKFINYKSSIKNYAN